MKKFRKWTALFCAGVMAVTSLAGCGGGSGEENSMEKNEENGDVELTAAEKSMGLASFFFFLSDMADSPFDRLVSAAYMAYILFLCEQRKSIKKKNFFARNYCFAIGFMVYYWGNFPGLFEKC